MTAPIVEPCLYRVEKVCYKCGTRWDGFSFVPHPTTTEPLPGVCAGCNEEDERLVHALEGFARTPREKNLAVIGDLDLQPPQLTGDR